jgi:hypothetical protein
MGKGGKGSSKAPDYKGAAEEQAKASKEVTRDQTWANRPNQWNPWGRTQWEAQSVIDPSTGKPVTQWNQYETLSPDAQRALDSQLGLESGRSELAGGMLGRVGQEIGNAMDWDQFGNMTGVGSQDLMGDAQGYIDKAENAWYDRSKSRLDEQFGSEQEALDIKLRNQGLKPGDAAYDAAARSLGNRKTDAYQSAMNEAIKASGAEGSRLQGMDRSKLGFNQDTTYRQADQANQLRQQAIKEEMTKRGFSLNEINALISGQQVQNPQFENFQSAGRAEAPQYNAAAMNQGNFNQAQNQGFMSGIGDLAGLGMQAYTGGAFGGMGGAK